jgi:type VI secretion system secreted protein Hcp
MQRFYMMFTGTPKVVGEAKEPNHVGWVEFVSFSWGTSNLHAHQKGAGGGGGNVKVQDITINKYMDTATSALIQASNVSNYSEVKIHLVGEVDGTAYCEIVLTNVIVTSYSVSGRSTEEPNRPIEQFTLNFAKLDVLYKSSGEGVKLGANFSATIDVRAGKAANTA